MSPSLLLSERRSYYSIRLRTAALASGWSVQRAPLDLSAVEPSSFAVYGEVPFAEAAAASLGVTLPWPTDDFLPALPERYRRRAVQLLPLAQARALPGPVFLKPASGREFASQVYASGAELPAEAPADTPVLAAEPVRFTCEVRLFIADRGVQAASGYRGRPAVIGAQRFIAPLLRDVRVTMPDAVVVDVGRIEGRGWAVVEANPVWSSALYDAPPRDVLPVLLRATGCG